MSNQNMTPPDNDLDQALRDAARAFVYPPTPDIAARTLDRLRTQRGPRSVALRMRLALLLAIVLMLIFAMAVPEVRAAILNWLRIGGVTIYPVAPTPTPTLSHATAAPTATLVDSLFRLAGRTTLEQARSEAKFPIRWPASLGNPDLVYYQYFSGQVVILVWLAPTQPEGIRLSLQLLGPGALVEKVAPQIVRETTVNGQRALWTNGPYVLMYRRSDGRSNLEMRRLMAANALIWVEGDITYRLESDLSLEEAVSLAESIR